MGANGAVMHASHRDAEAVAQGFAQPLGLRFLRRIIIDMGVIAGDRGHLIVLFLERAGNPLHSVVGPKDYIAIIRGHSDDTAW